MVTPGRVFTTNLSFDGGDSKSRALVLVLVAISRCIEIPNIAAMSPQIGGWSYQYPRRVHGNCRKSVSVYLHLVEGTVRPPATVFLPEPQP